ncbi:TIR domain-containing adapter molecule 1-like [Crotalus tigris]|uniref:TIR domain-containing adapter molecule 1-like n=1 Tax=Crotalus tigris TaxID=88082 RepID=UPI00192F9AFD|nr:TIR domain-containing adapter molecule 1-like [Crotalus tigris]XP_039223110.1 TIR domain-containing adapter molecule 1-like [Crotalus tigris]XP_039223164.1 TIR domain-containing adapter molecule 1-like [Crotalus tigris]XP_039223173.1 TIR domain-containing adapter molecule 1-like [Crotalus tigris]XP_039223182.1 TIR domain-containing adapter molecule 1-like [Crotalus tigris]
MPSNLDPALPRMTGTPQGDLGFEGILQTLSGIPAERLIQYRHKLSCLQQDRKSCHLLHVLLLWSLGREDEARVHLNSFRDDVVAYHLSQGLWGTGGAKTTTPEQLKDQAKVARAVAEIYSLLVEEKLCEPLARDEAYRTAIQAFRASHMEGAQLKGLLDEAMEKCGLPFLLTVPRNNSGALASGRWELPRRSSPVSIVSSSPPDNPQSLRSTGSPISYISNLQISETSTTSDSPSTTGRSLPLPSASQEDTGSVSLVNGCSTNSRRPSLPNSRGPCLPPDSKITLSSKASAQGSKHCTVTPVTTPSGDLSFSFQVPPLQKLDSTPSAGSAPQPGTHTSASASITSFGPLLSSSSPSFSSSDLASRSSEPSSVVPPDNERQFYTFVVLHAAEDELVACRVRERLEALGVSNGATFSEDFLIPGCGQLNCFQNALDNSAFTLVLLTKNFTGRLCDYQRDTALMDSLTRCCKRNSVIPLVPKEHTLKSGEMPLLLASLVPLVEKSPVFDKRVKKTFTSRVIQEKKATWDFMRQIQEREEKIERERENLRLQQRLAVLNLQPSPALPPVVDISRPQTSFMEPGPDQASFSQPFMFSMGSPNAMPGPQLIIQNAQMIQIGDYNRMQVERSNAAVGTANETIEGPPVEEGEDNPGERK